MVRATTEEAISLTAEPHEELVFFPSGQDVLAGILTFPSDPVGRTAIIPWGAGAFPSSARNRLRTRLAREIAQLGFHSFRFDYPGVGEASGDYQARTLDNSYSEEIVAASRWLSGRGLGRHVIVANCLGAWSTMKATERLPDFEGLVSYNCPIRRDHEEVQVQEAGWQWWIARIRNLEWSNLLKRQHRKRYSRWVGSKASAVMGIGTADATLFTRQIETLIRRSIPVLLMYGDDGFRGDFDRALESGLGPVLESAWPIAQSMTFQDRIEGFPTVAIQDQVVEATISWLRNMTAGLAEGTAFPMNTTPAPGARDSSGSAGLPSREPIARP